MSTQIAIRLAESLVVEMDQVVAAGGARSRASLVEAALERELRRLAAVRDGEVLRAVGSGDDLDGLVEWTAGHIDVAE